jgi:hypothetical protein
MFQETDRKFKEMVEDDKRRQEENQRKWEEEQRKREEEHKRQEERDWNWEQTKRMIGDMGNRFGELAEHLVAPNIKRKFDVLGFAFDTSSLDIRIEEQGNPNTVTEVDILLENGDVVVAVEVKAKPKRSSVDDHVKRMELLRQRADKRNDKRKYHGAIAGAIMEAQVRDYALKTGFYVIEQTGDTVKICIPEGFTPREW